MLRAVFLRALFVVATVGAMCSQARAGYVDFAATALGGNLWRYDYTINNTGPSIAFDELTVYFDSASYALLSGPSAASGWDAIAIQPDSGIPADGYYDALSLGGLVANGATISGFSVSFEFLGAGAPDVQRFEFLNSNDFSVVLSGSTSPTAPVNQVPEPSSTALILLGLAGIASIRRLQHSF